MKTLTLFKLLVLLISIPYLQGCTLERIDPPCPIVNSISPAAARAGDVVTINGDNFQVNLSYLYQVKIADKIIESVHVRIPTSTTMSFTVPVGIGSGPVTVALARASDCTSESKDFTYYYTASKVSKLFTGLTLPAGLDVDIAGNVIVADRNSNRISVIRPNDNSSLLGERIATYGSGLLTPPCNENTTLAASASFWAPNDIKVEAGNIYVADNSNSVIRIINTVGSAVVNVYAGVCGTSGPTTTGGPRRGGARLNSPLGIAFDTKENSLYFTDAGSIRKIDASGDVSQVTPKPLNGNFRGIDISRSRSGAGPIFVTEEVTQKIKSIDAGGTARDVSFSPLNLLSTPVALVLDSKGNIFIADKKHQVFVIYTNGALVSLAGNGDVGFVDDVPGAMARFNEPNGIVFDEKKGVLYVSDSKNLAVRTIKIE